MVRVDSRSVCKITRPLTSPEGCPEKIDGPGDVREDVSRQSHLKIITFILVY